VKKLLLLYPRRWRVRYGAEMEALLVSLPFRWRTVVDMLVGACDAHWFDYTIARKEHIMTHSSGRFRSILLLAIGVLLLLRSVAQTVLWLGWVDGLALLGLACLVMGYWLVHATQAREKISVGL
jgi:hypothetical protein